jgi:hypothetical protein
MVSVLKVRRPSCVMAMIQRIVYISIYIYIYIYIYTILRIMVSVLLDVF